MNIEMLQQINELQDSVIKNMKEQMQFLADLNYLRKKQEIESLSQELRNAVEFHNNNKGKKQ